MKTRNKIVSVICVLAVLLSSMTIFASAATYDTPVDVDMWKDPSFSKDHAYSIAFVGDTQFLTVGDYYLGTEKLKTQFKYIADTVEERKLEHVFVLGDLTDLGYGNDANLATTYRDPAITGEWEIVKEAVSQLDGKVTYQLTRGNHDDYMMDDYFNVPVYTDQFKDCGGFYVDLQTKYTTAREVHNPDRCIYWSAKTGCHTSSIVNSYKTVEICGTKYLFMTIDFNPTDNVLKWADSTLAAYPDHKAIIITHSYLKGDGTLQNTVSGTRNVWGNSGQVMWDEVFSKHANVFMIASGHEGPVDAVTSYQTGVHGNKVLQVLLDPQCYDTRESSSSGYLASGRQDTGLVLYMNFSADGKTVSFDYYSTLLNKFLKSSCYSVSIEEEVDTEGSIDMAGLTQFGQVTPHVTVKSSPKLDGSISTGEYQAVKTTAKNAFARGSLPSDLNEYFAYDDEFLYYAFTADIPLKSKGILNLHLGSSMYTVAELNANYHAGVMPIEFMEKTWTQLDRDQGSNLIAYKDIFTYARRDESTGLTTYEFKISRQYLRDNGSPDNLLSYTVNFGKVSSGVNTEHYFKLSNDANAYLQSLGVTKKYLTTYNYAYFGERPTPIVETTQAPTTEAPSDQVTEPAKSGGCNGSVAMTACAVLPLVTATAFLSKKKRKED